MTDPIDLAPAQLHRADVTALEKRGVLVRDRRRARPLYFDGRFLAARDLEREQRYFLGRLADLGRAAGFGVVRGLDVAVAADDGTRLVVASGFGLTGTGEVVVLREDLDVDLAALPDGQRLDAAFGLGERARQPLHARDGVFVLTLRAVEWTDSPTPVYPTSLDAPRRVADGDILEGTVATLVPFGAAKARRELARELFVTGALPDVPRGGLPIAVVALSNGRVAWVDTHLVRREVGVVRDEVVGLDARVGRLRAAHLRQYDAQLDDALAGDSLADASFAATDHFDCLPPIGRLPVGAVDAASLTQRFLPFDDVDLALVADDEIAALVEESLLLPPIDLAARGDEIESVPVAILVPVPRRELRRWRARIGTGRRDVRSAIPSLVAKRRPLDVLAGSRFLTKLARPRPVARRPDTAWQELLGRANELWFVRRRGANVESRDGIGTAVRFVQSEVDEENALDERLRDLGRITRFREVERRTTAAGGGELSAFLATSRLLADTTASRLELEAAIHELEAAVAALPSTDDRLDRVGVLAVADRFAAPGAGDGLERLLAAVGAAATNAVVDRWAESGRVPEIDRLGRDLPSGRLRAFGADVVDAAGTSAAAVVETVDAAIEQFRRDRRGAS